jgi:tetratricopeptide (TPR) repeat protein
VIPCNSKGPGSKYSRETMTPGNQFRILAFLCALACSLFCGAAEDAWIEVRSPHFIVISDATVAQARHVAKTLEQFRSVFQTALPKLRVDPGSPLIIFAVRDARSLKALAPKDHEQTDATLPAGIFMAGPEKSFVLLRVDATSDRGYNAVYHEYVHMVMNLNYQSLPLWLSEGFAELFGHSTISQKVSILGKSSPELLQILKRSPMIPLDTLMAVTRDSPLYFQQDASEIFYAQSWALTHYLMLGDKQAHAKQLAEFLVLIQNGVPGQEAAERALGDLKKLQRKLEAYIRSHLFYSSSVQAQLSIPEDPYPARPLSSAESAASRGELLVYADRPVEARALLEQALRLYPRSATANEGIGLLFLRLGKQEEAQKYFAEAAKLDSKSVVAQYYAAELAYERDKDYRAAESFLRNALEINSRFAPAYRMLSMTLMMQGAEMLREARLPEALDLAEKAVELEPAEPSYRINAGRILVEMGRREEAYRIGERALVLARTQAEREQAESLLFMIKERRDRIVEAQRRAEALREEAKKLEQQRRAERELEEQRGTEVAQRRQAVTPAPKVKTGPTARAEGLVRSVQCSAPAIMDVVLDSNGKQRRLRAEDYLQVRYWIAGARGNGSFTPCEELKGKRVYIEFLGVFGQEYSGLIKTVTIIK